MVVCATVRQPTPDFNRSPVGDASAFPRVQIAMKLARDLPQPEAHGPVPTRTVARRNFTRVVTKDRGALPPCAPRANFIGGHPEVPLRAPPRCTPMLRYAPTRFRIR